jgi:hypothetical protein
MGKSVKKKYLRNISADNPLEYYTNEVNIRSQELVNETIQYFNTGEGRRVFTPLELLNLLERQYHHVKTNIEDSVKVINDLRALPLNDLEKHVLFGLILKWFGGYPISIIMFGITH